MALSLCCNSAAAFRISKSAPYEYLYILHIAICTQTCNDIRVVNSNSAHDVLMVEEHQ
jgi:hypothetical protein